MCLNFKKAFSDTVVAIGKFTRAVLWSKTVIFRIVYCNVKMPPSHWDPQAFIPHISTLAKRYINLFLLKGLKCYQPSKFECLYFLSKTHCTFSLWLITFEALEKKQSYIPLLKVLVWGMNAWGAQWLGGNFTLQYTTLKLTVLLHKTALVNFLMATTVH